MRVLKSLSALLLLGAAPALAAPEIDAFIADIAVAPKSAAEVTVRCDKGLAATERAKAALESMPLRADRLAMLRAYDDLYNLSTVVAYGEAYLIQETNPDGGIRAAAEDCVKRGSALITKINMSRPIYERLQAVEKAGVAPELRYTIARQLENYRRAGVGKDDKSRARIALLQDEITATSLEFQKNIREDVPVVKAKPEELAGLPQDYLDSHKPGTDGMVEIRAMDADVSPVLRYAPSADLRKRVMTAWTSRAYPANDAVLKKLFAQRAELASLLGYPDFAHFDLANRMANNPARAQRFLDEIAAAARPAAAKDAARMLARLRKDDPSLDRLGAWSTSYASQLIRKEDYEVDPAVVRQYFSFENVQKGIFQLTEDLFGVQIRPWKTEVWAPGVGAWEMVEGGKVIGRFYTDMHPRENKYTHAAMFPVRIGIKGRVVPVAALLTNFPDGLMEHGQVQTFLHEFGHLLHWIFAGNRDWAVQNFSEIENDVTEAPSTLLEEWVWDYETLAKFATDPRGRLIPRELVARMNAGRNFGRALGTTGQLGFAAVALDYYGNDMSQMDLTRRFNETDARYSLVAFPEDSHFQASFSHLGNYGASYYTYQWSEALAADLLSRFRKAGLRDTATARAYRELILSPGGSESMNVLARNFLGRDWSVDAYRKELEAGSD